MLKLLIVEDDLELCNIFKDYFKNDKEIELCGFASDGSSAVRALEKLEPDVLLVDIAIPNFDGIEVIKRIRKSKLCNLKIIVLSGIKKSEVINECYEAGANKYLLKPVDFNYLKSIILDVFNKKNNKPEAPLQNRENVQNIMNSLGLPVQLMGTRYLSRMVCEKISDESLSLKQLYCKLADEYLTSYESVEVSTRNAINKAFLASNNKFKETFPGDKRPSVLVFLNTIVNFVKKNW